jgi:DNA-directed RNA polymerase specialized sigma24 family protein
MGMMAELAVDAGAEDPGTGLRAVNALKVLLAQLEAEQVDRARRLGWSWQEIANRLGVTKQTVHRKYAARDAVLTALRTRRERGVPPAMPVNTDGDRSC